MATSVMVGLTGQITTRYNGRLFPPAASAMSQHAYLFKSSGAIFASRAGCKYVPA